MEDKHDEQDNKVLVHGQSQANEDGVENNAELQNRNADELAVSRVGTGVGGRGSCLLISFLAVNVVVATCGVALWGWLSEPGQM